MLWRKIILNKVNLKNHFVFIEKLSKENPYRIDFFMGLVQSNQQLENYSEAERLIKDKLDTGRNFPQLYVELGL